MRAELAAADVPVGMVVLDEAHYVKNPGAQRTQASKEVLQRSEYASLMTGTPMENRPGEFANLVAMVNPKAARRVQRGEQVVGASKFRKLVADVYLRRNQRDVLTELPETIEHEDWVELASTDMHAYVDAVRRKHWHDMRKTAVLGDGRALSAKLARLRELLDEAAQEGRKTVVFSYYLDVLAAVMRASNRTVGPLTGKVGAREREELIQSFRAMDEPGVLVAQIQAGGIGINLQFASVVILMEPQIKPSTEEQAIARLKRMGQLRSVLVHRLFAQGTLEEDILEILGHKRKQFDAYARESLAKAMSPQATQADAVTAIIERQTRRLVALGELPDSAIDPAESESAVKLLADSEADMKTRVVEPVRAISSGTAPSKSDGAAPTGAGANDTKSRSGERGSSMNGARSQDGTGGAREVHRVLDSPQSFPAVSADPATNVPDVSPAEQAGAGNGTASVEGGPHRKGRRGPTTQELGAPRASRLEAPGWVEALFEREAFNTAVETNRIDEERALRVFVALSEVGYRSNLNELAERLEMSAGRMARFLAAFGRAVNQRGEVFSFDRSDGHVRLDAERLARKFDVDFKSG